MYCMECTAYNVWSSAVGTSTSKDKFQKINAGASSSAGRTCDVIRVVHWDSQDSPEPILNPPNSQHTYLSNKLTTLKQQTTAIVHFLDIIHNNDE